jgi:hypothetical protein
VGEITSKVNKIKKNEKFDKKPGGNLEKTGKLIMAGAGYSCLTTPALSLRR